MSGSGRPEQAARVGAGVSTFDADWGSNCAPMRNDWDACPCFSLARARKKTARAADIGIAGLFIVGIAVLVIDHDRFAACLAGMMMFRCSCGLH